eukprot:366367-Chlamydomonas_euryale.AAC.5
MPVTWPLNAPCATHAIRIPSHAPHIPLSAIRMPLTSPSHSFVCRSHAPHMPRRMPLACPAPALPMPFPCLMGPLASAAAATCASVGQSTTSSNGPATDYAHVKTDKRHARTNWWHACDLSGQVHVRTGGMQATKLAACVQEHWRLTCENTGCMHARTLVARIQIIHSTRLKQRRFSLVSGSSGCWSAAQVLVGERQQRSICRGATQVLVGERQQQRKAATHTNVQTCTNVIFGSPVGSVPLPMPPSHTSAFNPCDPHSILFMQNTRRLQLAYLAHDLGRLHLRAVCQRHRPPTLQLPALAPPRHACCVRLCWVKLPGKSGKLAHVAHGVSDGAPRGLCNRRPADRGDSAARHGGRTARGGHGDGAAAVAVEPRTLCGPLLAVR